LKAAFGCGHLCAMAYERLGWPPSNGAESLSLRIGNMASQGCLTAAAKRGPKMGDEESHAETLQLVMPEEILANRVSQSSVRDRAADFLAVIRRQASQKPELEERSIEFGGRAVLIGSLGTDFEAFVNHIAIEMPIKTIRFRLAEILGNSELTIESIRTIVEFARRNAPSLVFVERLEMLGPKDAPEAAVLQSELEHVSWDKDDVLVVASSTFPARVDPGILSVFDRAYLFDSATSTDRVRVLEQVLKGRTDIDASVVAEMTEGWSFADVKHLAVSLLMTQPEGQGQVSAEKLEQLIRQSGVLPVGKKGYVRSTVDRLESERAPDVGRVAEVYPDSFLDQLYLMAVGEDFAKTQRVVESLNAGLPLSSNERSFLSQYPFLLGGTPEDRLTRLLRAKKSHDRLARIMGR